jgi:hypothetical protein
VQKSLRTRQQEQPDRTRSAARRIVSIPRWARITGLADDGRSIASARRLLAQGDGPAVVKLGRPGHEREGIRLADNTAWVKATPWAAYLSTLPASEHDKQQAAAMRIVGDAAYTSLLYDRYIASRWRFQMTFEQWLKRRQRLKDRHTPRLRANKGGK